jgi:hypothetical protein
VVSRALLRPCHVLNVRYINSFAQNMAKQLVVWTKEK